MKIKSFVLFSSALLLLTACSDSGEESTDNASDGANTEETSAETSESTSEENSSTSDSEEVDASESSSDNLLDIENSEGGWINFSGESKGSPDYKVTPEIEYDPASEYELNIGAYISYFSNGEFLETVQSSSGPIEQVEDADTIRVSYHNSFEDKIALTKK